MSKRNSVLDRLLERLRVIVRPALEAREVIVLHEYKALYYPIPKVACSSLKSMCVDLLDISLPQDAWKPDVFQTTMYDEIVDKSRFYVSRKDAGRLRDYWSFAFVRNPWDRLVSCYTEKIRSDGDPANFVNGVSKILLPYGVFFAGMSFSEFAISVAGIPDVDAEPHFKSQYTFITTHNGQSEVDFIGRFERLSEDFAYVSRRLGFTPDLPHLLTSAHRDYRSYYDSDLATVIHERYRQDIELFGYEF